MPAPNFPEGIQEFINGKGETGPVRNAPAGCKRANGLHQKSNLETIRQAAQIHHQAWPVRWSEAMRIFSMLPDISEVTAFCSSTALAIWTAMSLMRLPTASA